MHSSKNSYYDLFTHSKHNVLNNPRNYLKNMIIHSKVKLNQFVLEMQKQVIFPVCTFQYLWQFVSENISEFILSPIITFNKAVRYLKLSRAKVGTSQIRFTDVASKFFFVIIPLWNHDSQV
jgi:hypothetical protein